MLDCTPAYYWQPVLTYVLPPAGALLSAIALWVASRARSTSEDARLISAAVGRRSDVDSITRGHNASRLDAPDRRKP